MNNQLIHERICRDCGSFYPEGCRECEQYVRDIFFYNDKKLITEHLRELIWFSYREIHKGMTEDEINNLYISNDIKSKISKHLKHLENGECFRLEDYD